MKAALGALAMVAILGLSYALLNLPPGTVLGAVCLGVALVPSGGALVQFAAADAPNR